MEFLVAADGRPYFLEMNTRLQVEHPVTECVTGLDLVGLQIRIAEGAALPPEPPAPRGHAVEARLYAEDPARGWQPQPGPLHRLDIPGVDAEFAVPPGRDAGLRLDSGVTDGEVIGVHYDPMLAKVIAWAPTRAEAVRRLAARAGAGPAARPGDQPRPAGPRPAAPGVRRRTPGHRFPGTPRGRARARRTRDGAAAPERFARAGRRPRGRGARPGRRARGRSPAPVPVRLGGWRNVPSQPQSKRFRSEPDGRSTRSATGSVATA